VHGRGQTNGVADNGPQDIPTAAGRATILNQQPAQARAPQQRPGESARTKQVTPSDEMAGLSLDRNLKRGYSGTRYV
jgi:hypothetical protein